MGLLLLHMTPETPAGPLRESAASWLAVYRNKETADDMWGFGPEGNLVEMTWSGVKSMALKFNEVPWFVLPMVRIKSCIFFSSERQVTAIT